MAAEKETSSLGIRSANEPIYLKIYKQLLKDILEGHWKPGERLPPDMPFSESLGVNHLTLKKALNRLTAEGYLNRTRGRGTFIADVLPKTGSGIFGYRVALIYDMVHEDSFQQDFFLSIYRTVTDLGLTLELLSANNSRTDQFKQIISLFSDPDSAGCIVWPLVDRRQLENLAAAKPKNFPLVFINYKPELDVHGIDFSGYDDFGAGMKMGEYINASGCGKCIICQCSQYRKKSTNIHRIAGLQTSLNIPHEIFSNSDCFDFNDFYQYLKKNAGPGVAVVMISDSDYARMKDFFKASACTPFVFFTSVTKPDCPGVLLSCREMGENAVRILEARRNGNDEFSISHHVSGVLV